MRRRSYPLCSPVQARSTPPEQRRSSDRGHRRSLPPPHPDVRTGTGKPPVRSCRYARAFPVWRAWTIPFARPRTVLFLYSRAAPFIRSVCSRRAFMGCLPSERTGGFAPVEVAVCSAFFSGGAAFLLRIVCGFLPADAVLSTGVGVCLPVSGTGAAIAC